MDHIKDGNVVDIDDLYATLKSGQKRMRKTIFFCRSRFACSVEEWINGVDTFESFDEFQPPESCRICEMKGY